MLVRASSPRKRNLTDDVQAQATILSPIRAQIIEVNRDPRSSANTIPPRVSSLSSSLGREQFRDSWASSSDSSLDMPTGEWEFDDNRCSHYQEPPEPVWIFPRRSRDLAMLSPPFTPKFSPAPPVTARCSYRGGSTGEDVDPALTARLSLQSSTIEAPDSTRILSDLEEAVVSFPATMLALDTPCIPAIRLALRLSESGVRSPQASPHASPPTSHPQATSFSRPRDPIPSMKPHTNRDPGPHPTRASSSQRHTAPPAQTTTAWRSSSFAPSAAQQPTPDLEPLRRIFPSSSETARSQLYAHMLAYTFVASLPAAAAAPARAKKWRDTPFWSSLLLRAAAATQALRVATLKAGLRLRILGLMGEMDPSFATASPTPASTSPSRNSVSELGDEGGAEDGAALAWMDVLLRTAGEVVRACETAAFASSPPPAASSRAPSPRS